MNLEVPYMRWDYLKVVIEMSKLEQLINELCPEGVEYDFLYTVMDYELKFLAQI